MTTFTVASDVTYSGVPTGVDLIDFTNAIYTVATATFAASDFDNVEIFEQRSDRRDGWDEPHRRERRLGQRVGLDVRRLVQPT